jgi:hypothetical protein
MKDGIKFNIIFRTCDKVNAVHGSPRPYGLDKLALIKLCFKSLIISLKNTNYSIYVVADDISIELKNFLLQYNIQLIEGVYGNDNSIRETFKIASTLPEDEYIYFCEDDYLHTPDCFEKISALIKNYQHIVPGRINLNLTFGTIKRQLQLFGFNRFFSKPDLLIFPCDYPDRYYSKQISKSFIYIIEKSYWRQVNDVTFTFLIQSKTFKKHQKTFNKSAHKANDRFLSRKLIGKQFFFNKTFCLSPMPSLSNHMHTETMSPVVNWEQVAKQVE